ncbi:hypothetical protein D9M72_92410 [compost metagenome]
MKTKKIKVAEISRGALNWAVAMAEGYQSQAAVTDYGDLQEEVFFQYPVRDSRDEVIFGRGDRYTPSTNWMHGGPIIERERVWIAECSSAWSAKPALNFDKMERPETWGSTPLEAAMRCYVASKLGDEVDVPEALLV